MRIRLPSAIRDFLTLASGTGFGQLIILAVTPILAPDHSRGHGPVSHVQTFVTILSTTCSLGFETAIIDARDDDALPLVGLACILSVVLVSA